MKKTVGVLSLIVMLLSQIITPFTYAVSGEEVPMPEPVVEEQGVEPVEEEVVSEPAEEIQQSEIGAEKEPEVQEPGGIVDEVIGGDHNMVVEPGVQSGIELGISSGDIEQLTGGEKNLEEENSDEIGTGKESSFIETIKDFFGIGDNKTEEEKFESREIYGTGEYEGVKVEVYAQTGLFASGTELTIEPVVEEKLESVQEVLLSGEVDLVEEQVIAFDITFRDPLTQEELQPKDGTVQVKFNYEENESLVQAEENEEQEVKVYHLNDIDEEGNKIEELTGTTVEEVVVNEEESEEENVMVVDAESFSVYTIVVQVRQEQLISFQYGMISIANPSNPSEVITIMDRNLGATTNDRTDKKSYGYHYQRGNNYGFDSSKDSSEISTSSNKVNVSSLTEYTSSTFIIDNTSWMTTNKNLWGEGGQGPCPEGWHVPASSERENLYSFYNETYVNSGVNGFFGYFKLPYAGERRHYIALLSSQGSYGYYWSSSPSSFDDYAYYLSISSYNGIDTKSTFGDRADAYSVRCFKNSPVDTSNFHKILIDYRGGKGSTAFIDVEHGSKGTVPSTPIRWNSNFLGWYLSGTDTEFDFTGTTITEDKYIYAKWSCNNGFIENRKGDGCVYIVPYNFDANGGFFSGYENNAIQMVQYFCGEEDCYTNDNLKNPDRLSQDMLQQSGWMFVGWYMKSGENGDWGDEFNPKTATTSTAYAKWLPFNDISIKDGDKVLFTIMDRNLGAEAMSDGSYGNSDLNKLGYYYQWGNNYGFSNNSDATVGVSLDKVDASGYGPNNYYSSNIFIKGNSSPYEWDLSNNKNLWGGMGDSVKRRGEGTDEDRQGPCPVGYHIPSIMEWKFAYLFWNDLSTKSIEQDSVAKNFAKDFNLPFAGYRYYSDVEVKSQGSDSYYWSSSSDSNGSAYYFNIYGSKNNFDSWYSNYKSYGYSVRCFKNTSENLKKLVFLTETGNKIVEYDLKWWESMTSDFRPENPQRDGYEFIGRYESGSNEEYDFSKDRTTDLSLYEKWAPREGVDVGDTAKLLEGTRFNSTIKSLVVGEFVQYKSEDRSIEGIERSSILPEGGNKKLISSEDSQAQIFAWYDAENKKIKYYTKAKDVYLNEDSSYAFYYLRNLKTFDVNEFRTDYVTNMERMFSYSFSNSIDGLTLDFKNTDLSNVKNMKEMFAFSFSKIYNSSDIPTMTGIIIDFSNVDLSSLETMEQMFFAEFQNINGASGVKIDFSNANLNNVTTTYQMFGNRFYPVNGNVEGVTISFDNAKFESLKNMKYMFEDMFESARGVICNITITLENVKLPNVEDMSYMFTRDFSNGGIRKGILINLKNVVIDHEVNGEEMFDSLFNNGSYVEGVRIDFSNANLAGWSDMHSIFDSSFRQMGVLSGLYIDFSNTKFGYSDMSYMFGYSFQSVGNITGVTINFSNSDLSNVTTLKKMFVGFGAYGKSNVEGILIDFSNTNMKNVTTTQEMFDYAFQNVTSISGLKIDFSNSNFENLTTMESMFRSAFQHPYDSDGSIMKSIIIDFGNANLSNVTNINQIFEGVFNGYYSRITSDFEGITINFNNTDLSNLGSLNGMFQSTFKYAKSIDDVKIDFTNANLSSVTTTQNMFNNSFTNITNVGNVLIVFDNIDMHNVSDMNNMFSNAAGIKWLDLSGFDTSNVTNMQNMFYNCTNLTGLDLSSFDTSNVTNMNYMFEYDSNLKTIYVGSRFRTNNVTSSSYMFYSTTNIVGGRGTTYNSSYFDKTYARVDKVGEPGYFTKKGEGTVATLLPGQEFNAKIKTMAKGSNATYSDTDTYIKRIKKGTRDQLLDLWLQGKTYETLSTTYSEEPVNAWFDDATKTIYYYTIADEIDMNTNASNMFSNLTKLEEVELEGINTNSVSNMTSLFQNDTSLTGMDLSNFDASSVTSMQNMFNGCSGIKSINLSNANMSRVTNISGIFGGCSSLETVDFSNADIRSLTSFASIFPGLPKLREVNFHKVNLSSLESTQSMFGGISSLKYADFSDANLKSVQLLVSMFGGSGLTGADFSNADLRNAQSASTMFGGIGTLLMVNFENTNMMNVTDMSSIFGGCSNLNWVTFSGANIGNVTTVYSMFGGDSKLETVDFTEVNLSKLENMSSMFGGCSGLTGMDFSKMDLSRVTNMDGLFSAALKLESVNFGDNDFRNVTNMRSLFRNCGNLEELDITKFDTRNVTNMSEMFYGVANLKTIYVGDNFKTDSVTNSTDMFDGAVSLVGGNGTTYDESKIDKEYAVADVEGTPGYFTNIIDKKYTITYHLEGGELTGERTTYTERTNVYVLPQPTKEGYTFEGWVGSNGNTPEINVSLEGMKGDLEFTAKWKVIVPDPEPTPSGNTGGGGSGSSNNKKVIDNQPTEKEHESADEKQETNQDEQLKEQEKEQTKTPEKTNTTPNQTSTQESSNNTSTKTVTVDPEIQSAYEWAYAHDVTTISPLADANPDGVVTRGHLAKMVVNYATNVLGQEIPEKIPSECRWNDWRGDWESEEIKDYAVKSCALGLMGLDMEKFLPNMQVTRAQFGTIMSRLLWGKKYAGGTPYYRKHLNALKENGIMTQIENPERRVELRQWVWVMLMRSAQNK